MTLNPPKMITWVIGLVCLLVSVLMMLKIIMIPALNPYQAWLPIGGLGLMLLATLAKGL